MMNPFHHGVLTVILAFGLAETARGQAEANVWGGLRGIRVEGELMTFTTGFRAVPVGQPPVGPAQQERLSNPQFVRQGVQQTSSGGLMAGGGGGRRGAAPPATVPGARGRGGAGNVVNGQVTYEDVGTGRVNVTVTVSATADTSLAGIYFIVHLPMADYADGTAQLVDPVASAPPAAITGGGSLPSGAAKGVRVTAAHRQLEVTLATAADIVVQPGGGGRGPGAPRGIDVYFPVCTGTMAAGQTTRVSFTLQAAGDVDRSPITVVIDPAHPGSPFLGIGGNFRMQQAADAPQAAYNLENLRVPWARADLPLAAWQPTEDGPPNPNGGTGYFGAVAPALAMQKILSQKKIPVILSVWSLPEWARSAEPPRRPGANGGSGYRLNAGKWDALLRAIGAYFDQIKRDSGLEPRLFSFNESDGGYDVLQSPAEHTAAIKRLGAFFAAKGVSTKMLLGDTADPAGGSFLADALADPEALRYVGAVSFHSWRGGTPAQFTHWGEVARQLGVPLIVAEGGMDSDAYRYPALLREPWYALVELGEYLDICRLAQPSTILQWQLTENYSLLTGGGGGQPLAPTQRFWQLKQLNLTPLGAVALPVTLDRAAIEACAFGEGVRGEFAVHLLNHGATRRVKVGGFPANLKELRAYVTDAQRGLTELPRVPVVAGVAQLALDSMSFVTLTNAP